MNSPYLNPFSKSLLTGLFVGIIATLFCLAFNVFFRESHDFPLASIINVSSLIFAVNLIFLVIGLIYYGFVKKGRTGELFYKIVFVLLTIYFSWRALVVHRSDNPAWNQDFHWLMLAVVVIMGILAAFGIPYLFHNRKFEEHVL
ncbi:MAG: hypothetical protein ACJ75B_08770 [Flavisolibacter sp.]